MIAFSGGPATHGGARRRRSAPAVAAVQLDPAQPKLLRDNVEDVRFPNYEGKFGWEAVGTRTDEIGGRETKTVFYRKEGRRIAYTIVEGDQLAWPPGADKAEYEGIKLRTFSDGDRTVVTWRRNGRTCVLSATNVPRRRAARARRLEGPGRRRFLGRRPWPRGTARGAAGS